jgi:hypothetical protein
MLPSVLWARVEAGTSVVGGCGEGSAAEGGRSELLSTWPGLVGAAPASPVVALPAPTAPGAAVAGAADAAPGEPPAAPPGVAVPVEAPEVPEADGALPCVPGGTAPPGAAGPDPAELAPGAPGAADAALDAAELAPDVAEPACARLAPGVGAAAAAGPAPCSAGCLGVAGPAGGVRVGCCWASASGPVERTVERIRAEVAKRNRGIEGVLSWRRSSSRHQWVSIDDGSGRQPRTRLEGCQRST